MKEADKVMAMVVTGIGAVVLGLGVWAMAAGVQGLSKDWASKGWPTTQGVVIFNASGAKLNESGELTWEHEEGSGNRNRESNSVYRYEVAGTEHFNNLQGFTSGSSWSSGSSTGGGQDAENRISAAYAKGAKVKVSYFPTDPNVAVVEPGTGNDWYLLPGLGVFLILFGLEMLFIMAPGIAK